MHRTRAVIYSALGDPAALPEATRAIALAPESADGYMVRARVRRRSSDLRGALADAERALALDPGDPRALELRGVLKTETGDPRQALTDLDRAIVRGAQASVRVRRAVTLMALGQDEEATREWSNALKDDPENPEAYLGRARAHVRLRQIDRALVDLEQAADWAAGNPGLSIRITFVYASCLGSRPDRLARWRSLAQRALSAWIAATAPAKGQVRD
jgi:Tfp pilus assembly protein PilF